jgi:F-type H+-transporting ATPase subunit delta
VENGRLVLLPEIFRLYAQLRSEHEGLLDVEVAAAYALDPELEKELSSILGEKLGREVKISSEEDPGLIGGVRIRAGDLVIDGSVAGQLSRLANELGI